VDRNPKWGVPGSTTKIKNRFFEDYAISGMTKDFEGGYWLTSLKKGVLYVPSFEVFEDKLNTDASLKLNCISINDQQKSGWAPTRTTIM
jgi:hypothetical protein